MNNSLCCAVVFFLLCIILPFAPTSAGQGRNACEISDPLESLNRGMYRFNQTVDRIVFKPAAKAYRAAVPEWGRYRVHDFLNNLTTPLMFLNAVLQGDFHHSMVAFWRFVLNSTFGLGGLFDFASQQGLYGQREDFGQTLGRYGVRPGPYLVLPLLGPSSLRDTVGWTVDTMADPFNYILPDQGVVARYVATTVDKRERLLDLLEEIEDVSLDPYAAIRSLYVQRRASDIRDGRALPYCRRAKCC